MKVAFFFLFFCFLWESLNLSCKETKDKEVDFFAAIKPPGGKNCIFVIGNEAMKNCAKQIDDKEYLLGATLSQVSISDQNVIVWNDQPLGCSCSQGAHSKGMIVFGKEKDATGFLIIHSTPNYANFDFRKVHPFDFVIKPEQTKNGQNFLCINLNNKEDLGNVYEALSIISPNILYNNFQAIPENEGGSKFNTATFEPEQIYATQSVKFIKPLKTIGTSRVQIVAMKSFNDEKDYYKSPYEILIEKEVLDGEQVYAQSWQPKCFEEISVTNIMELNFGGNKWATRNDHSKWAVDKKTNVCFGDLNSTETQLRRGGIFICADMKNLNENLREAFKSKKRKKVCKGSEDEYSSGEDFKKQKNKVFKSLLNSVLSNNSKPKIPNLNP